MKSVLCLSLVLAFSASLNAEIVQRNKGVRKLLPGNQITVSGNGAGVVTVGVSGSVSNDTTTIQNEINAFSVSGTTTDKHLDAVDVATGSLRVDLSTTATALSNLSTAVSTGDAKDLAVGVDTTSLSTRINNSFVATSTSQAEFKASSTSVQNNINLTDRWLSTTTTEMHTLSVPVGFSEEGSFLANATRVDFVGSNVTATNSGSTITVTVAAGSSAAGAGLMPCTVRLGPLNSPSGTVDIASNTDVGWTEAVRRIGTADTLSAGVLALGATVYGTVCMSSGNYVYSAWTIPPGVTMYGQPGTSVTIVPNSMTSDWLKQYGTIDGNIKFNFGSRTWTAFAMVDWESGARTKGLEVWGAEGGDKTAGRTTLFRQTASTNVYANVFVDKVNGGVANTRAGGLLEAIGSSDTWVNFTVNQTNVGGADTTNTIMAMQTRNYHISGEFKSVRGQLMNFGGGNESTFFENATLTIDGTYASGNSAVILGIGDNYSGYNPGNFSSGSAIRNVEIYHKVADSDPIITLTSTPQCTNTVMGMTIENVHLHAMNATKPTFINIIGNTLNTVVKNSSSDGSATFISDSGIGTKYLSLGSTKDAIPQ